MRVEKARVGGPLPARSLPAFARRRSRIGPNHTMSLSHANNSLSGKRLLELRNSLPYRIESKRAIVGVWHQISGKHMGCYPREVEIRLNHPVFLV